MDLNWIWKAILITVIGTFLLRIAGRKSISQMTLAQVVIMIGIGSLLIQPLAGKSIWVTFGVGITLVVTLVLMEYLQLKSDIFEKLITGKSKVLIENGKLNEKTLKKLRFTIDQLEMKLRQNSISSISDVKWATLEPNGQLGFELTEQSKPITKKEWNLLYQEIQLIKIMIDPTIKPSRINNEKQGNLFTEVKNGKHDLKERPSETLD